MQRRQVPPYQAQPLNITLPAIPPADLHAAAMAALAEVEGPEMGENLVDLGVVERVEITADRICATLIPTSTTCPMADARIDDATATLQRICPPGFTADAVMDRDNEWSPERLAPALRGRFGW